MVDWFHPTTPPYLEDEAMHKSQKTGVSIPLSLKTRLSCSHFLAHSATPFLNPKNEMVNFYWELLSSILKVKLSRATTEGCCSQGFSLWCTWVLPVNYPRVFLLAPFWMWNMRVRKCMWGMLKATLLQHDTVRVQMYPSDISTSHSLLWL